MTSDDHRLLTADEIADNAKLLGRPLDRAQRRSIGRLVSGWHGAYVLEDPLSGAIDLAARMLAGLLAQRIDPDVVLRVVDAQLTLLDQPVREPRALLRAYDEMVDTGLDFSLSEDEMIERARPLIGHAIAG